jgi:hypothetical protein
VTVNNAQSLRVKSQNQVPLCQLWAVVDKVFSQWRPWSASNSKRWADMWQCLLAMAGTM